MKKIEITNGPSREELFDGLRLVAEKRLIPFCFKMNEKEKFVAVLIKTIHDEDESGQSWGIEFNINKRFVLEDFFVDKPEKKEPYVIAKKINFDFFKNLTEENYLVQEFRKDLVIVRAYYSTKTRNGFIDIE